MELTPAQEDWLQALESGQFKQGNARLKQRDYDGDPWRYCCLGVACEQYLELFPGSLTVEKVQDQSSGNEIVAFNSQTASVPDEVKHHLRLYTGMGAASTEVVYALWELNDGRGSACPAVDFCTIAKIIRANPEHYFYPVPEEQSPVEPSGQRRSLPAPQS